MSPPRGIVRTYATYLCRRVLAVHGTITIQPARSCVNMICPKCGADLRSYERNGVTIDQCTGCRGIFLDRGELERLLDAEGAFYAAQPRQPEPRQREDREYRDRDREHRDHGHRDHDDDDDRSHGQYGSSRKRKGSFLDELFG
jgi:Zn-finger nucleic acid-binding protein